MRFFQFSLFLLIVLQSAVKAQPSPPEDRDLDRIFNIGTVQSLMIEKDGTVLHEEFRSGMTRNSTTNIKSASKSIISLLVGIAIDEGYLENVDQTIVEFFPDYFEQNPDSAKEL
jgi:CubicO group peptidase (beta-lactamase class C family)